MSPLREQAGEWQGFPEAHLRELAAHCQVIREYLGPFDLPTVHRSRDAQGYPVRMFLVGSKAHRTVIDAMVDQLNNEPNIPFGYQKDAP